VATVYNLRVAEYHTYFVGSLEWGFSVWAHNAYFANQQLLNDHFNDHGMEVGATTPQEYEQYASGFLTGPLQPSMEEGIRASDGSLLRFDNVTQEFGVLGSDGNIVTYFIPDPAIHGQPTNFDYFQQQLRR
jgi:filamentous hemagglutinin